MSLSILRFIVKNYIQANAPSGTTFAIPSFSQFFCGEKNVISNVFLANMG